MYLSGWPWSLRHLATLCFAVEDFVRTQDTAISLEDDGQISCTYVLQQWNRPRKHRLDSKMVQDISFRNEQYGSEPKRSPVEVFDPYFKEPQKQIYRS